MKKFLSLILALCMIVCMLPMAVFAEDTDDTVDIEGEIIWDDANNQDGMRSSRVTVYLLADGIQTNSKTVRAADNWSYSFTGLPMYNDGTAIVYTVAVENVGGYGSSVNGYDITLTHVPEITSVSGTITWNDADNQDGKRPEQVILGIHANGVKVKDVTVTAADNWSYSVTDLPRYNDGRIITYVVTEQEVEGYTASYIKRDDRYEITLSYTPEITSVSGSIVWNDADNQDGKRPEKVTVDILADGEKIDDVEVQADEEGNWNYNFSSLPKNSNGQPIVYTVEVQAIDGYAASIGQNAITLTHTPETRDILGSIIWDDNNNLDGVRPEKMTVRLFADGVKVADIDVTVGADGEWSYSFDTLPKYSSNGKAIKYTIEAESLNGYTVSVDSFDVIATKNQSTTEAENNNTTPNTPTDTVDKNDTDTNNNATTNDTSNKTESPKTGHGSQWQYFVMLGAMLFGCAVFGIKRRKSKG